MSEGSFIVKNDIIFCREPHHNIIKCIIFIYAVCRKEWKDPVCPSPVALSSYHTFQAENNDEINYHTFRAF